MAITLLAAAALAASGAALAAGGQAVGKRIQARGLKPSEWESRELSLLRRAQEAGEDALTTEEDQLLRERFLSEQGQAAREAQAVQLQAAAARGGDAATSGRELFLSEQAAMVAGQTRLRAEHETMRQAELDARERRRTRIAYLEARQQAYDYAKAGAQAAAVAVPFEAVGSTAETVGGLALEGKLDVQQPPDPATVAPQAAEPDPSAYATGF